MSIADVIELVRSYIEKPPNNEAATRFRIIDPLLAALGYGPLDIDPEVPDNSRGVPDYTILPDTPHQWYLEAKAWGVTLADIHAQQATTYTYQNGKRWVVLTNGRVWQLYDSLIHGKPLDRLVAEATLQDVPSLDAFLQACAKTSVCSGGLERFATVQRRRREDAARRHALSRYMGAQLLDENSKVVTAIWDAARSESALSDITKADVLEYFRMSAHAPTSIAAKPANPSPPVRTDVPLPIKTSNTPERFELRRRFWTQLLARATQKGVALHARVSPSDGSWIGAGGGRSGLGFNYVIWTLDSASAELYIDVGDYARNKRAFDYLHARKETIEQVFGGPLSWERLDDKRACRIAAKISLGGLRSGEENWPAIQDAMIDAMDRLHKALSPHIQSLPLDVLLPVPLRHDRACPGVDDVMRASAFESSILQLIVDMPAVVFQHESYAVCR